MSTAILDMSTFDPVIRFVENTPEARLAAEIEELASLRSFIVLKARWDASGYLDKAHRAELCDELQEVRWLYAQKLDAIAMDFGVAQAIQARKDVERSIAVPQGVPSVRRYEPVPF